MPVAATGRQNGRLFLNSERDYRDQRNLTISIDAQVIPMLANRYGATPDAFFRGKWVEVRGFARRTRIGFFTDGRPTGKYYYQTHIRVSDADQILAVRAN